ncbi:MAG: nuclear transport factor 2 family protein [Steroidobacteraceae bacterium]
MNKTHFITAVMAMTVTIQAWSPAMGNDLIKIASSQARAIPRASSVTSGSPIDTYGQKEVAAESLEMASSRGQFARWLLGYGHAWTTGNPAEVAGLFSRVARYYETPFEPPMTGPDAIYKYWAEGVKDGQSNVTFHASVISVEHNIGMAHWHATRDSSTIALLAQWDLLSVCRAFRFLDNPVTLPPRSCGDRLLPGT